MPQGESSAIVVSTRRRHDDTFPLATEAITSDDFVLVAGVVESPRASRATSVGFRAAGATRIREDQTQVVIWPVVAHATEPQRRRWWPALVLVATSLAIATAIAFTP